MRFSSSLKGLGVLVAALVVVACQSPGSPSSSGPSASGSDLPVVSAGADVLDALVDAPVHLDGSATTGATGYQWSLETIASGSTLPLGSLPAAQDHPAQASFTPDHTGVYGLRLTATNASGSTSALVHVYVRASSAPVPVLSGGTGVVGSLVTIDGSRSLGAQTWTWTVTSAPDGSEVGTSGLAHADQSRVSFTPDLPGVYTVQLLVGRGEQTSSQSLSFSVGASLEARQPSDEKFLATVETSGLPLVYEFSVEAGKTYYLNWDDDYVGSGDEGITLDAQVDVTLGDGTTYLADSHGYFVGEEWEAGIELGQNSGDSGYIGDTSSEDATPVDDKVSPTFVDYTRALTIPAGQTKLRVKVAGWDNLGTGTVGLRFSSHAPTGYANGQSLVNELTQTGEGPSEDVPTLAASRR